MRIRVKAGARRSGTLTALEMRIVSNTGAYGNHAGETLYHACGESIAVYRCPNKKIDGYVVYTNLAPAGGIAATGSPSRSSRSNPRWTNWLARSIWIRSSFAAATPCDRATR